MKACLISEHNINDKTKQLQMHSTPTDLNKFVNNG